MNLKQALERNPKAATELSASTRWRYEKGVTPKSMIWFFKNPEMFHIARNQYLANHLPDDAETTNSIRQPLVESTSDNSPITRHQATDV